MRGFRASYFTAILLCVLTIVGTVNHFAEAQEVKLDVNDVSVLWPVPTNRSDVEILLSASDKLSETTEQLWPSDAFAAVLKQAHELTITNSAGLENKIDFRQFEADFAKPSNWKVVSFRVDPSAVGSNPAFREKFGEIPQLRLVLQPVTVETNGTPKIHDFTVHLVYSFVERFDPPPSGVGLPIAVPDKVAFGNVVSDLNALRQALRDNGVVSAGKLSVHPGLRLKVEGFVDKVKSFVLKHATADRFSAVAFMGIQTPEPWIFFAMRKVDGALVSQAHPTLSGKAGQMLIFRGGSPVMPIPQTTNFDGSRGVHTSVLFNETTTANLDRAVFADVPTLKNKNIPDVVANPTRSHFFNTDCVSCHTESSRRVVLNLGSIESEFQYRRPDGMSPVDESLLPKDQWNVRNFGWFPPFGGVAVPTATMRTANESAESADFINKHYLGQGEKDVLVK